MLKNKNNKKKRLFAKKSLKIDMLKIKNILKLEIVVIIQVNTELMPIVYAI